MKDALTDSEWLRICLTRRGQVSKSALHEPECLRKEQGLGKWQAKANDPRPTNMAECVLSSARSSTKHSSAFEVDGRVMSR